jgi:hypothetical protein
MALYRLPFLVPLLALASLAAGLPCARSADPLPVSGRSYALLVGVKNYRKDELTSLKYTENDVATLAKVLKEQGYKRVVLMTQKEGADNEELLPTAGNIRDQVKALLEDRKEGDSVLIALSGHGVQFKGEKQHYFCPMGTRLSDTKTMVSLGEIYDELKGCKASVKVLLVDACRSDPDAVAKFTVSKIEREAKPQAIRPPGGVAALFSCSEGQFSYESDDLKHGVFFHFVIEGLKGKAANKGKIDLLDLVKYAQDEVPDYVKDRISPRARQIPNLVGDLSGRVTLVGGKSESPTTNPGTEVRVDPVAATDKEVEQALTLLLTVRPKGREEPIRLALWALGPLSRQDSQTLGQLARLAGKDDLQLTVATGDTGNPSFRRQFEAATRTVAPERRPAFYGDARQMLDRGNVDAILVLGIWSKEIPEYMRFMLEQKKRDRTMQEAVEYGVTLACESGKDVYVATGKNESATWKPRPKQESGSAAEAALKHKRVACMGTRDEDHLAGFLKAVRDRSRGPGSILDR